MDECKFRKTERFGLYLMVFITMINTCDLGSKIDRVTSTVDKIVKVEVIKQ